MQGRGEGGGWHVGGQGDRHAVRHARGAEAAQSQQHGGPNNSANLPFPVAPAHSLPQSLRTSLPPTGPARYELTKHRWLARWIKSPSWQFQLIIPNQILFWVVIVVGLVGISDPEFNFATAITWFVWFCLVFVLILVTGRGWCAVCPFGGLAEWVQRGRLWHRKGQAPRKPFGLNRQVPDWLARYGYLPTFVTFLILTWVEEYFEVAGPGDPPLTSYTVLGIIAFAFASFLVFERRSFCRYLCPLAGMIGTLGAQAPVAGFRAKDRQVCFQCTTKDCLRGNENGYGCPWFNWPGGAESNVNCGMCGECFRTCPSDNVGLYVTKPMVGLTTPVGRRADVAWTVTGLAGIVVYQQVNATETYGRLDDASNALMHFPHYPNPLLLIGTVLGITLLLAVPAWLASVTLLRPGMTLPNRGTSFVYKLNRFRVFFLPLMYSAIPLVAADYLARQLPKFMTGSPKVIPAVGQLLGLGDAHDSPLSTLVLGDEQTIVLVQIIVVVLGAIGSIYALWHVAEAELTPVTRAPMVAKLGGTALMILGGWGIAYLYILMKAAA